jgi:hypothetical protein
MAKFLGLAAAFGVFYAWMRAVGNPHVVETSMGVAFAVVAGFVVFFAVRRW